MTSAVEPFTAAVQIRPARAAEQRLVRALVNSARLDPTNLRWQNFLLAEVDGQVVGCIQVRRYPGLRELGSMVVKSNFRKRGVGRALMQTLLAQQSPPLFLECPIHRVSFYEQFGFRLASFWEIPWILRVKWLVGNTVLRWMTGVPIRTMRWDGAPGLRADRTPSAIGAAPPPG